MARPTGGQTDRSQSLRGRSEGVGSHFADQCRVPTLDPSIRNCGTALPALTPLCIPTALPDRPIVSGSTIVIEEADGARGSSYNERMQQRNPENGFVRALSGVRPIAMASFAPAPRTWPRAQLDSAAAIPTPRPDGRLWPVGRRYRDGPRRGVRSDGCRCPRRGDGARNEPSGRGAGNRTAVFPCARRSGPCRRCSRADGYDPACRSGRRRRGCRPLVGRGGRNRDSGNRSGRDRPWWAEIPA